MGRGKLPHTRRLGAGGTQGRDERALEIGLGLGETRGPRSASPEPPVHHQVARRHGLVDRVVHELRTTRELRPKGLQRNAGLQRVSGVMVVHEAPKRLDEIIPVTDRIDPSSNPDQLASHRL